MIASREEVCQEAWGGEWAAGLGGAEGRGELHSRVLSKADRPGRGWALARHKKVIGKWGRGLQE